MNASEMDVERIEKLLTMSVCVSVFMFALENQMGRDHCNRDQ